VKGKVTECTWGAVNKLPKFLEAAEMKC